MVQRLDADLGVAFDGDGDRLGVVTQDGQNIFPDRLLMLFAADVLERNPGAHDHLRREVHRPPAGPHPAPRRQPADVEDRPFADQGEDARNRRRAGRRDERPLLLQGALVRLRRRHLRRRAPAGDPVGAARIRRRRRCRALPDGVSTPEIKVDAPGGDPHSFVERFRSAAQFEGARLSTIDGLRVDFPDGWGLVRASNTTPVLVMRFDADSADALQRIQAAFRAAVAGAQAGPGAAVLSDGSYEACLQASDRMRAGLNRAHPRSGKLSAKKLWKRSVLTALSTASAVALAYGTVTVNGTTFGCQNSCTGVGLHERND